MRKRHYQKGDGVACDGFFWFSVLRIEDVTCSECLSTEYYKVREAYMEDIRNQPSPFQKRMQESFDACQALKRMNPEDAEMFKGIAREACFHMTQEQSTWFWEYLDRPKETQK